MRKQGPCGADIVGSGEGEWGKLMRWMGRGVDGAGVADAVGIGVVGSTVCKRVVVEAAMDRVVVGAAAVLVKAGNVVVLYLGIP